MNCWYDPYGTLGATKVEGEMSDAELADFIYTEFPIRELVRVYYNDPEDGKAYAVNGGIYAKGHQVLQLKGLSMDGQIATMQIWMKDIVDIERYPDQRSPYTVEEENEARIAAIIASNKSSYEERTLETLRAAGIEIPDENSEVRAAGVRSIQEKIWNEGEGSVGPTFGPASEGALAEEEWDEDHFIVSCGKCPEKFANLKAYWNHLDDHDMAALNSGKYN